MMTIDGSDGEGGGQVVRAACALSLLTGEPFRMIHARGGRRKPGLMRQHVTAVEAARAVGGARCDGVGVGATEFSFSPGRVTAGEYRFAIGTAGSAGLVLQTVLMPLVAAAAPSRLIIEGGTHNALAPPFEFLDKTFLPVINRMGPKVEARLLRHGFYPRGGGRLEVDITPAPLAPLQAFDRGEPTGQGAEVLVAALNPSIAERLLAGARKGFPGWPEDAFAIRDLPPDEGPGTVLLLEAAFEHVTEVASGAGRLGTSAEQIASGVVRDLRGYLASGAFAGAHLADQLMLPLALAGGGFSTVKPTPHCLTVAALIDRFTGRRSRFDPGDGGCRVVTMD